MPWESRLGSLGARPSLVGVSRVSGEELASSCVFDAFAGQTPREQVPDTQRHTGTGSRCELGSWNVWAHGPSDMLRAAFVADTFTMLQCGNADHVRSRKIT